MVSYIYIQEINRVLIFLQTLAPLCSGISEVWWSHSPFFAIIINKSDITCLKKQPRTFAVHYTLLSLGQANCSCRTTNYSNYATIGILQKLISKQMQYSSFVVRFQLVVMRHNNRIFMATYQVFTI